MIAFSYNAVFGGVALDDIVELAANYGRRLAEYQPARGDGVEAFDLGREPRRYQIQATLTGTLVQVAAKRADLVALADSGDERTFTHPLDGPVQVRLAGLQVADGPDATGVTLSLVETRDFETTRITPVDGATFADVEASADALSDSLGLLDVVAAPDVDATVATVARWSQDTTPAQMALDRDGIASEFVALDTELSDRNDTGSHLASVASITLQGDIARYSLTLATQSPQYGRVRLNQDAPLVVFLSERVGALRAGQILEEVVARNSIRDPRVIRAGTELEIPR